MRAATKASSAAVKRTGAYTDTGKALAKKRAPPPPFALALAIAASGEQGQPLVGHNGDVMAGASLTHVCGVDKDELMAAMKGDLKPSPEVSNAREHPEAYRKGG